MPIEAMIEREPITVICSKMGWVRSMKGHVALDSEVKFKDGDEGRFLFHAETTDKILLVGSNGRFYTLLGANLPGGRGMGEPVRLMVDLPNDTGIVDHADAHVIADFAQRFHRSGSAGALPGPGEGGRVGLPVR